MDNKSINVFEYFQRYSKTKINGNTTINNELEFIGDDADFLIIDFSEKFNVNMKGFDFSKYFHEELLFKYLYYKWFKPKKLKRTPLTINHMEAVAEKGYWFEPD